MALKKRSIRPVIPLLAGVVAVALAGREYFSIEAVSPASPHARPIDPRDPKLILTATTPVVFASGPAAQELATLCPGASAGGTWAPDLEVIHALERTLQPVLTSGGLPLGVTDLSNVVRQYVGIYVHGKKLVCLSASPVALLESSARACAQGSAPRDSDCRSDWWRREVIRVNDGGMSFWRIVYDPETGEFSNFEANGEA